MNQDISEFDKVDLLTYLSTLASLAHSDGDLHEKEVEFIYIQAEIANISPEEVFDSHQDISDGQLISLPPSLKKILIRDALVLAYIDGDVSKDEREMLRTISKKLEIDDENVNAIENWLIKYWQILEEGNDLFN